MVKAKKRFGWFAVWGAAALAGLCLVAFYYLIMEYRDSPFGGPGAVGEEISALSEPMADHVYLIVLDGLRADAVDDMPHLKSLGETGAAGVSTVEMPTFSRPAYARIITGACSSVSNINSNEQSRKLNIPNLYDLARHAGLKTGGSLYFWFYDLLIGPPYRTGESYENRVIRDDNLPIQYGYFYDDFNYTYDDREIFAYGTQIMLEHNPNFMIIHTMELDIAGHDYGGASPEYREIAVMNDALIQEFIDAIPDPANSVVIITGDHGHIDAGGHGGLEEQAATVPLVIVGKGVNNVTLPLNAQLDLAPTVSAILGLPFTRYMEGEIIAKAFDWPDAVVAEKSELLNQVHAGFLEELYRVLEIQYPGDGEASVAAALDTVRGDAVIKRVIAAVVFVAATALFLVMLSRKRRHGRPEEDAKESKKLFSAALLSTVVYIAAFNLIFHGVGLGYSYSAINSVANLVVKAPLAVLLGYLVFLVTVLFLSNRRLDFERFAAHTAFALTAIALLLLAGVALQGGKGFVLPDYRYYMLTLFSSFQLFAFAFFSAVVGGVLSRRPMAKAPGRIAPTKKL